MNVVELKSIGMNDNKWMLNRIQQDEWLRIVYTIVFITSITDMSNINVRNCSSSLKFLGDYEIGSVEMKSGDEMNGEAIMKLLIDDEEYELRVPMKGGKKEGVGVIVRKNGTLFMRMMFVNDECEGEVTKMNEYGRTVLKGRTEKGRNVGMWIEYDDYGNEKWRGLYRNGVLQLSLKDQEGKKGFYSEISEKGETLSVSEYDDNWRKNGKCYEYEDGKVKRECEYKNGRMIVVLREWKGEMMTEYDVNGMRVYEGEIEGDMINGFVREGKGTEYGIDGKSILYVGGWKNGYRDGYGSEFCGMNPVYIGEWKNGLRDGNGEEYDENGKVIRKGKWIKGGYDIVIKRFKNRYGNDLSVFDVNCLKGVEILEIGNDSFKKVKEFVIDGWNELESIIIGNSSFMFNENSRGGKCLIMNCDKLREIHIGWRSFYGYESFECKNLPSLISIQLNNHVFLNCNSIVFESEND